MLVHTYLLRPSGSRSLWDAIYESSCWLTKLRLVLLLGLRKNVRQTQKVIGLATVVRGLMYLTLQVLVASMTMTAASRQLTLNSHWLLLILVIAPRCVRLGTRTPFQKLPFIISIQELGEIDQRSGSRFRTIPKRVFTDQNFD